MWGGEELLRPRNPGVGVLKHCRGIQHVLSAISFVSLLDTVLLCVCLAALFLFRLAVE